MAFKIFQLLINQITSRNSTQICFQSLIKQWQVICIITYSKFTICKIFILNVLHFTNRIIIHNLNNHFHIANFILSYVNFKGKQMNYTLILLCINIIIIYNTHSVCYRGIKPQQILQGKFRTKVESSPTTTLYVER